MAELFNLACPIKLSLILFDRGQQCPDRYVLPSQRQCPPGLKQLSGISAPYSPHDNLALTFIDFVAS